MFESAGASLEDIAGDKNLRMALWADIYTIFEDKQPRREGKSLPLCQSLAKVASGTMP